MSSGQKKSDHLPKKTSRPIVINGTDTPIMWGVIVVCCLIALFSVMPQVEMVFRRYLSLTHEAFEGQIWRFFTPVLLHGNALHLFFNMIWIYQLGGEIERIEGSRYLAFCLIGFSLLCNFAQYFVSGPNFLGMSGVVYAFLGYAWMMTRYKSGSRYGVSDETMIFMGIWLAIGVFGIIPGVANTHHVSGLVCGLVLGGFKSGYLEQFRNRR